MEKTIEQLYCEIQNNPDNATILKALVEAYQLGEQSLLRKTLTCLEQSIGTLGTENQGNP